jgi:hypothetical protein
MIRKARDAWRGSGRAGNGDLSSDSAGQSAMDDFSCCDAPFNAWNPQVDRWSVRTIDHISSC